MADCNGRVAYVCQWCGESFHQVTDSHSMPPVAIYTDKEGNQFDSLYCKKMYHGGWGETKGEGDGNKHSFVAKRG